MLHCRTNSACWAQGSVAVSAVIVVAILIYFPNRPPNAPSVTATIQRTNFGQGVKDLFKHKNWWLLATSCNFSATVFHGPLLFLLLPTSIAKWMWSVCRWRHDWYKFCLAVHSGARLAGDYTLSLFVRAGLLVSTQLSLACVNHNPDPQACCSQFFMTRYASELRTNLAWLSVNQTRLVRMILSITTANFLPFPRC